MFRTMSEDEHLSGERSSSSAAGKGGTSAGADSQESSWTGLLSVVSRPALSFLHKYLSGRLRSAPLPGGKTGGDPKNSFMDEERDFLRQLDDMMPISQIPVPHLTYLRYEHDGAAGSLNAESLREMGIQSEEEIDLNVCHQNQMGYVAYVRTLLSHMWWSLGTSQEIKVSGRRDWGTEALGPPENSNRRGSKTLWHSFLGGESSTQQGLLSDLSWAWDETYKGPLCPQQPVAETKAPVAQSPAASPLNSSTGWTLGENTGLTDHNDEPVNNEAIQTVENMEVHGPQLSSTCYLSCSEAAATDCGQLASLTPDQDNGYSSLEEEHVQMCRLFMVKAPSAEHPPQEDETPAAIRKVKDEERCEEAEHPSAKVDEEVRNEEQEGAHEDQSMEVTVLSTPQCQNKTIAFIMGCPCSDDDSSQSEGESSDDDFDDDDDDDGFDSKGSSDLSDSSDEDDEDSEVDSEAERLWSSLSYSRDPYNPQNFTAHLHTGRTPPRTIPMATPPSSTQSTPASSPDSAPLASPPSGADVWDDSTSASEVDEAESLRLWSSFSCSSDPYSPLNFQAPLSTRGPAKPGSKAKKSQQTPCRSPRHAVASPPESRKEGSVKRLDFCEVSKSSSSTKKVSVSSVRTHY